MTSHSRPGIAHKPAELFRSDLISAMKLPDSLPMESSSYFTIKEPWRREWEFGVQVCVSPELMPKPAARTIDDPPELTDDFRMPPTRFTEENTDSQYVQYDLDDMDLNWLEQVNLQRKFRALAGPEGLSEDSFREAIIALEAKCQQNMACAVATDVSLGIEYDEGTVCDVCRDRESEDTNDMIFCDSCNVCVHQACYGIPTVPKGHWLCKVCSIGETDTQCVLCHNTGGALKRVRPGNTNWAHLSCALWIPEVRVGNAEKMEPITNTEDIPPSRWNLICCVCRRKQGACVQCSHPHCVTAYHITCAFKTGLETHTRLDIRTNGVIHESYCPKHSPLHRSPSKLTTPSPHKNNMTQFSQLQHVSEQFYTYVAPDHLAASLCLSPKICVLIYNYWKLKRKSLHNRPLLFHLPIETASVGLKAELALGRQYGLGRDPNFLKIISIRQNLEKARNLVYMVQRRERLKKRILDSHLQILEKEAGLGGEEADKVEEEEEEEMETQQPSRQTRSMTHRIEPEPCATSLAPPTLSLPPTVTSHPLPSHHSHKEPTHPLPLTTTTATTCNHTPNLSEAKSMLPSPLLFRNSATTSINRPFSLPVVNGSSSSGTSARNLLLHHEPANGGETAGGHVTSPDDHMTLHAGHMTLRRRDAQCSNVASATCVPLTLPPQDLTKQKTKLSNGECSPSLVRKFSSTLSSKSEEQVLKTGSSSNGPARNLRFRPYTVNKT